MSDDIELLPEPTAKETVPPRNQLDDLFDAIEEPNRGLDAWYSNVQEKLVVAREYNDGIRHSCKVILAESDRYFRQGNAEISRLASDKDELTVKLRQLMRDLTGKTTEQTIAEIKEILSTSDGGDWIGHDCPTCQCWTTDYLETPKEDDGY